MINRFALLIIFIVCFLVFNYSINKRKRDKYIKAGKKWDGIVKELSRRK